MSCGAKATKGGDGLSGLTVKQLQQILKDAGKDYRGNRAELCERIIALQSHVSPSKSPSKKPEAPKVKSPLRSLSKSPPKEPNVKSPLRSPSKSPPKEQKAIKAPVRKRRANILLFDPIEEVVPLPAKSSPPRIKKTSKIPRVSKAKSPSPSKSKGKGKEEASSHQEIENPITEVTPAEENIADLRMKKLRFEKETNIFDALVQPFPKNYGTLRDGTFTEEIIHFTNSDEIKVASASFNLAYGSNTLDNIGIKEKIGKDCVFIIHMKEIALDDLSSKKSSSPYFKDLYDKTNNLPKGIPSVIKEDQSHGPEAIKQCIRNGARMLYLHVANIYLRGGQHFTQVILNVGTKRGWLINSAEDEKIYEMERISMETYLRHYIDSGYTLETRDFDTCPPFNIQGPYGTCVAWGTYIFVLSVLNPELTEFDIAKILIGYTQKTRNYIITIYHYYFYMNSKHLHKEAQAIVKDKFTRKVPPPLKKGEKLEFYDRY